MLLMNMIQFTVVPEIVVDNSVVTPSDIVEGNILTPIISHHQTNQTRSYNGDSAISSVKLVFILAKYE